MISFNYEHDFKLVDEKEMSNWISSVISSEEYREGVINYIFCNDEYLHKLNVEFLEHDTLADVISFDYKVGKELHGDIFISVDRVKENAKKYEVTFYEELNRVMVHGTLHFCGYKDKSDDEKKSMREKENHYLNELNKKS